MLRFSQVIASDPILTVHFGFSRLHATLLCEADSQMDKLRAVLLDIRQPHVISDQNLGGAECPELNSSSTH